MARQSFLGDETWDETHHELEIRTRVFERAPDHLLTGSLHELAPGSPGFRLHMHYGAEEMFFVMSGNPLLRTGDGEEQLAPGDVVHSPDGREGLHTFTNPTDEPVRLLAVSAGRFPDVVAYPEHGIGWVATRNPDFPVPATGDPGIVARFDLPDAEGSGKRSLSDASAPSPPRHSEPGVPLSAAAAPDRHHRQSAPGS